MRAPTAHEVVRAWEVGEGRPEWFRALLLLSLGAPVTSFGELARLSLGQRNTRVAALRRAMFGEALTALCSCPRCGVMTEFTAGVADLAPGLGEEDQPREPFVVATDGDARTCRAATSEDLAELEGRSAPAGAVDRTGLALRCLETDRTPTAMRRTDGSLVEAVLEGWYAHDPGFETTLELACDGCGHPWSFGFDWPGFVWAELAAAARRLMGEVGVLARAFGWREPDVLALGAERRRVYLDQATA